jgi:DtxR family Mn-dependent transcriptional regulator
MSVAVENFIKAIYNNKHQEHLDAKPGTIAKKLGISNAAATDMSKKLAEKGLLEYKKYQELKLTEEGTKKALLVIRKHRLWEAFLYNTFDMNLHDIHREAELLEHETSDFLANKISEYLGNPKFDPHGDPIPNANGEVIFNDSSIPLSSAKEGDSYTIARLLSDNKEFFDFCAANGIKYGNTLAIVKQFNSPNMTQIQINTNTIILNQEFTSIIYVEKIN